MTDLAAYIRVSTDKQVEGTGLDVQREAITDWAKANGHRIVAWYSDEGKSGALKDREGWGDADAAVRDRSVAGIVVYRLDRLARGLIVQEQLMGEVWRSGGEVYSTAPDENNLRDDADNPDRKLVRRIMGSISEYEREVIVLRMRHGRRMKAKSGGFAYGSPPFGYVSKDGELVKDPTEQAVIKRITALSKKGASLRAIAATLNDEGRKTKRGRSWTAPSVGDVLTRARTNNRKQVA